MRSDNTTPISMNPVIQEREFDSTLLFIVGGIIVREDINGRVPTSVFPSKISTWAITCPSFTERRGLD
jgi:hypothetical protein